MPIEVIVSGWAVSLLLDTRLEADLPGLLWSFVNLFHRKAERINRKRCPIPTFSLEFGSASLIS